jgi:hypothetical protein
MIEELADNEGIVAVHRDGRHWSVMAYCCRELSGRTGVHRIAAVDEPMALRGFAALEAILRHTDRRIAP